MKPQTALERRYRRLLRLLPRPEREARGEEMLGVLLDGSAPGQRSPSAGDTIDLVFAAVRSRLRLLLVIDPVARLGALGAAVLLVLAATLAVGDLHWRGSLGTAAPSSGTVLPDRFPSWQPKPVTAADDPAGPAMMAYVDGEEDTEEFIVVLGADGSTARRVPLVHGTRAGLNPALLSPDGRRVAQPQVSGIVLTDLVTGARRTLQVPALEGVRGEPRLLAWSADAARIAVQSGPLTAVTSTDDGRTVTLPVRATSAAFAPDGRLALADSTAIEVYAADATLLGHAPRPEGWQIAPAGWSGDVLALSSQGDADSEATLPAGDPGLRVAAHADVPALLGSPGRSEPLGWQGGRLIVEAGGSLVRWDPSSLRIEAVTLLGSNWFKGDVRLATGLAAAARAAPLGDLDRGGLSPAWPLTAGALAVLALLLGWCYPPTHVRLRSLSTRAAISTVGDHVDVAIWLAVAAAPVVFLGVAFTGFEPHLLLAVLGLVAGSAYALGRSLGRARYVTGRTAAWTTARRATG